MATKKKSDKAKKSTKKPAKKPHKLLGEAQTKFTYVIVHEAKSGKQAVVAAADSLDKATAHLHQLQKRKREILEPEGLTSDAHFHIVPVLSL